MKSWRSRAVKSGGGLVGLLMVAGLVLVPATPAAAVQTITWTTAPPTTAVYGQTYSMEFTGVANTFLGARITGCFFNFSDGMNYTRIYGGNFTTNTCSYNNRVITQIGINQITAGFTLSTGGTMTLTRNITVTAPTPIVTVPSGITTPATSASGAIVSFSSSAYDSVYGTYASTCTPSSGFTFHPGSTTVNCTATSPAGATGSASFVIAITKSSPTLLWSPPSSVVYGTTYGDLSTAAMQASDATGTITYARADGTAFAASDLIPVGGGQVLTATYVPSGQAASAYNTVATQRTVAVVRAASAVSFGSGIPETKQYGDAPFSVDASGSLGAGVVTITAQAGSDCSVSQSSSGSNASATVTLTGAGTCVLLADQPETATHIAAPTAQWSVTIDKANPQLAWTPPTSLTYGESLSALLGATADVSGTFTYLINGVAVDLDALLDVSDANTISVTFTPDDLRNYVEATDDHAFAVTPAAQTLTVDAIDDQTFGADPFALVIGGVGPGAVSATTSGACTVDGLTVTLVGAGECTLEISKAATSNYSAASSVTRSFTIDPGAQTLTVEQIDDKTYGAEPFVLDVAGDGPGDVTATASGSCAVQGITVIPGDVGTCTLTISKAATSDYSAATPVIRSFAIEPAEQTLAVAAIADRALGSAPFVLDVDGTGPGDVTATATGACTVSGLTVTLTGAGLCTVTVHKSSTSNYDAAPSVERTFTVIQATPILADATLAPAKVGTAYSVTLTAEPVESSTFEVTGGTLPGGLSINPTTGVISGTPEASGSFEFTVTATNAGGSGSATYTIRVALAAGELSVSTPRLFTAPGAKVALTVSGLAPNEAFAVSLRGVELAEGTASSTGKQTVTVVIPKTAATGKVLLEVVGSTDERTGRASQTIVSASRKLTFSLSPKPIVQSNRTLKITVHGLAAGEPVKVTFRGKTVSSKSAKADSKGNYTVKVSAGWSWGYKTITATGSSAKRYGTTKIDVEARR